MSLTAYLPQDRLRALSRGDNLPNRTAGSAMLADISGFTTLTEALRLSLGPRKGAEELSLHLNAVFSALIAEVERSGGSVVSFAGDAIICWFDQADGRPAARALTAAFAMQAAMGAFAAVLLPDGTTTAISVKAAIATGPASRFVVGDPDIHLLDVLAGAAVERTAAGEQLAGRGEVLVDQATVEALGEDLHIKEWRVDVESGDRFAAAESFAAAVPPDPQVPLEFAPLEGLRAWLPSAVLAREQLGTAGFQTEFRPCTVLFVRFGGIRFELDTAQERLNAFVSSLQAAVEQFDAVFMQLTIGDKGSYAYLNFGALHTHENDPRRAVRAALGILAGTDLPLQIGIAAGTMRVGAYGSDTRRAFGALGDDVNLAARLMTIAGPGEILVSGAVHQSTRADFNFEPHAPLPVKGKTESLPVFSVTGERKRRAVRLQEPTYALPMVGRQQELALIEEKLDLAAQGRGQVIGIEANAGLGKSRLVAEVIRSARRRGFTGFGGACQSDGVHTPYQAWMSIWQAFFDVDNEMPVRKLIRLLEGEIEDRAPDRVNAIPLLNAVLDLDLPENDFTRNLEPIIRQSALHALLEDCLKSLAGDQPTLIVIEDLHWIDALSYNLLEQLGKSLAHHAVGFVLAYRPQKTPGLETLPHFTRIELEELTESEAESVVRAKLAQLYPARQGGLPDGLLDALMARAQGNPFYLEELLNYVRDRGLDPANLDRIELPDSLHTLILSRIDQLSEQEKTTLLVASIIGRLFRARWLTGYYPALGNFPQVKAALDSLDSLEITPLDSPEPELIYLFKHIVTHEVTYESLPFATRARLHEQLALYLETQGASVEMIAFHYGRSENQEKQREYLRKAGKASQKKFANDAALEYYGKLLALLDDSNERALTYISRGEVLERIGDWENAEEDYRAALISAGDDQALAAAAHFALGKLNRLRGNYEAAFDWLARAKESLPEAENTARLAQVLIETGMVHWRQGAYARAKEPLYEGLVLAREAGDRLTMAQALNELGSVGVLQGDYAAAQAYYQESLALRREMGDKRGIGASLNNLGNVYYELANYPAARALYDESLALRREMGDKWGISASFGNLGIVAYAQGAYEAARALHEESLALKREMGDKQGTALALSNLGNVALAQADYASAQVLQGESLELRREMGDKWGMTYSLGCLGYVAYLQRDYAAARGLFEETLALSEEMKDRSAIGYALFGLGLLDLAERRPEAHTNLLESLNLRRETGEQLYQVSSLIGIAALVLQEGDRRFAAQLLGAVDSALKNLNATIEGEVIQLHGQTLAAVRKQEGEAAFQAAWDEGYQWPLAQAVAKALEKRQPPTGHGHTS